MVATVRKNGTPVWYLMARRRTWLREEANPDFQAYATAAFIRRYLLAPDAGSAAR